MTDRAYSYIKIELNGGRKEDIASITYLITRTLLSVTRALKRENLLTSSAQISADVVQMHRKITRGK